MSRWWTGGSRVTRCCSGWNDHTETRRFTVATDTFRRLATRLEKVLGSKTAKQFEPLKIFTVGDLMRHVPRRYFSGTELSDLALLQEGEEVAVMAEVVDARPSTFLIARTIGCRASRDSRPRSPIIGEVDLHFLRSTATDQLLAGPAAPGARASSRAR